MREAPSEPGLLPRVVGVEHVVTVAGVELDTVDGKTRVPHRLDAAVVRGRHELEAVRHAIELVLMLLRDPRPVRQAGEERVFRERNDRVEPDPLRGPRDARPERQPEELVPEADGERRDAERDGLHEDVGLLLHPRQALGDRALAPGEDERVGAVRREPRARRAEAGERLDDFRVEGRLEGGRRGASLRSRSSARRY